MEGYSLEKWRNAPSEDLPPEQKAELEKFDNLFRNLDESLEKGDISAARYAAASLAHVYKTFKHFSFGGYQKHEKLRKEYAETKEGQWMLAHREAGMSNEVYDKLLDDTEDRRREYAQAVEKVTEAGRDLNFDDKKVAADLEGRKGLPRKTPAGPSLAEQLGKMIP